MRLTCCLYVPDLVSNKQNHSWTSRLAAPVCRVHCLKYLVLASMLMESHVDPFNAQETQPYRSDPQIQAMTELVVAYQNDDIHNFERVLNSNRSTILEDPFIRPYMEDLMTALRTQVLFCCSR